MNAKTNVALLNNDVAAGLFYCISESKINTKHRTTACFVQVMQRWFKLLTSRYAVFLSLKNKNYDDNIKFLKYVQDIMYNLTVNNTWKPFQTSVILSTQTALDLQKIYLKQEKFQYFMFGRLTQGVLKNAFSTIKFTQPVPDAHMFRVSLRLVCLSQFQTEVKRSNLYLWSFKSSHQVLPYNCSEKGKLWKYHHLRTGEMFLSMKGKESFLWWDTRH